MNTQAIGRATPAQHQIQFSGNRTSLLGAAALIAGTLIGGSDNFVRAQEPAAPPIVVTTKEPAKAAEEKSVPFNELRFAVNEHYTLASKGSMTAKQEEVLVKKLTNFKGTDKETAALMFMFRPKFDDHFALLHDRVDKMADRALAGKIDEFLFLREARTFQKTATPADLKKMIELRKEFKTSLADLLGDTTASPAPNR